MIYMIGERLKEVRSDHHDTQKDLARKLNVSISTVQSWEQEKSEPSHTLLVAICNLYQVSADFLLGLKDDDPVFVQRRIVDLNADNQLLLREFADLLLKRQDQ